MGAPLERVWAIGWEAIPGPFERAMAGEPSRFTDVALRLRLRLRQGRAGEVDKYVIATQGAARRAASLTHRLLAFSQRQTPDPKPTNVTTLVAGMQELIQPTIGRHACRGGRRLRPVDGADWRRAGLPCQGRKSTEGVSLLDRQSL